ncbi:hypothetical protein LTR78_004149 [Recurvomyces mirabilis]|uniref:FAD-binding domain-containing protein n=1 Tax=Recurvomyces mirabilis TaxID=574656 RepID=A0AAE1C2X6_9PEZI|nr:hypothetical protein LTR78_004149 [Recurvomyces mirabilis]KAK5153680.1 hypothetical protein LTS14_007374 [Recurvomyces mirabilis]
MATTHVDVFIVGAGPVGLLLAYQLARHGLKVHIIDGADKSHPDFPMYGRACTLHSRTLELLDQNDLLDDMLQVGVIGKQGFAYKEGHRVQGRGWNLFAKLGGQTNFDYSLNIRLKYSEDFFRQKLSELGIVVDAPAKLLDYSLHSTAGNDEPIEATYQNASGPIQTVRAKYIIGSDGGSSSVRKLADIPFLGERHVDHWVRIDGIVKSNVPEQRVGFGAVESPTHGQVLWVALDHGATRIGYALSEDLYQKYGTNMSAADAAAEARKAVAPFDLEFIEIHWHTVYGIQQHVAERFQDRERILLAGDAAHTHSSSAAQGMNTGVHDATALSWRLAGVMKGWYKPEVLSLYSDERRESSQHLIELDKLFSKLIARQIPESMKGQGDDPMVLLDKIMTQQAAFTLGLGISYPPNLLNDVQSSTLPILTVPGHRFPDTDLHKNGDPRHPVRLHQVTKHNGKFRVIVYAGIAAETRPYLQQLRTAIDKHKGRFDHAVDFLTIIAGYGRVFDEHLGIPRFGNAYWDMNHSAHALQGVVVEIGAIAVLRPDGILGYTSTLDGYDGVVRYLERLIVPREPVKQNGVNDHTGQKKDLGEFLGDNESALAHKPTVVNGVAK